MNIHTGAMVLLLAILSASMAAAAPSEEIMMVVDEPLSIGGDLEYGSFNLPDGKTFTLSRKRQPGPGRLGCGGTAEYCDVGHWCCGTLRCTNPNGGTCEQSSSCTAAGNECSGYYPGPFGPIPLNTCCYPLECNGGTCG